MGARWGLLAPAALLLALACQPGRVPVYGPWEEGLTLGFEDPSLPPAQRWENRLQVRVARASMQPGPPTLVQLDVASLRGQLSLVVRHKDSGISLVDGEGRPLSRILPEGFPATGAWTDRGTDYQVLGRAAWDGAALLPATSDPVGVWVEARPASGPRRRTLYLPNLGEVETREARGEGWVTVNRLVSYGFTDLPAKPRS